MQGLVSRSLALDAGRTCAVNSGIIAGFVCLWRLCFLASKPTPSILFFLASSSVWDGNRLLRFSKPQNFGHHISNKKMLFILCARNLISKPGGWRLVTLVRKQNIFLYFALCRVFCLQLKQKTVLRDASIVAVGTPVTRRPLHRSLRAIFPHRALQTYSLA